MKCHTCGHQHRTMASVSRHDIGTRWYCHESDHSCYTLRNWDKCGLGALDRITLTITQEGT